MASIKEKIVSLLKISRDPVIDHLGDFVKAIPAFVAVGIVIAEFIKDVDNKRKELIKPVQALLESLESEELDETQRAEKIKQIEKTIKDNPEIAPLIRDFAERFTKVNLAKAKDGDRVAFVTGIILPYSVGIKEEEVIDALEQILTTPSDELKDMDGSPEFKKAMQTIAQFIDDYYGGLIGPGDYYPQPDLNENGDNAWERGASDFAFNFPVDASEYDPDVNPDISYFQSIVDAINTVCMDSVQKKMFSEFYLFGFTKEEAELYQDVEYDD